MPIVGSPSAPVEVARTSDFNITRNECITLAYQDIGVTAEGETLPQDLLLTGIKKLNLLMREHDLAGKHLWAIPQSPAVLDLAANTFVYTIANGLPETVLQIIKASYRGTDGMDRPLKVLTTEQYEDMENKTETGDPAWVYLTEHRTVNQKTLYVGPMLPTIATQSVVTGSDSAAYACIRSHQADSTNQPITGANYLLYWTAGGSSPATWATGTSYTAPQHLRLWFKRPLYDFDSASDNPDVPPGWSLWLQKALAVELSSGHTIAPERVNLLRGLRNESQERVFRSVQPTTTEIHNKVTYF